jgi:pimeloyl-ACP methyl ester carboxylesterase
MSYDVRSVPLRTGLDLGVIVCGRPGPEPALVLVPGVGGTKEIFSGIVRLLARDRLVVAVDLSPRVARGRTVIDSAVEDLLEVVDALGIASYDLLGHSFGALVAARAIRSRPAAARKLVLANPAVLPATMAGLSVMWRWFFLGAAIRYWPQSRLDPLSRFVRRLGGFPLEPGVEGPSFEAMAKRIRETKLVPLIHRLWGVGGRSWASELEGIAAPILVVEGDQEFAFLPQGIVDIFRGRPKTHIVEIPGGHLPFLVRPEEFAREVDDFLRAQ